MTKSNLSVVDQLNKSVFNILIVWLFKIKFFSQISSISLEISSPVIFKSGQCASKHNDTPPVPIPTSRTVLTPFGTKAASHTASLVGL